MIHLSEMYHGAYRSSIPAIYLISKGIIPIPDRSSESLSRYQIPAEPPKSDEFDIHHCGTRMHHGFVRVGRSLFAVIRSIAFLYDAVV